MANLKEIKKRIGSLKNTSQITKAMKMVSAAKLRRAQESIVSGRPYAEKMQEVLKNLSSGADSSSSALLEVRPANKVGIILFTSDRGLCGGFNANLIKNVERLVAEQFTGKELVYSFYGKKGLEYFRRRGVVEKDFFTTAAPGKGYSVALELSDNVIEAYLSGDIDEVYLIFGQFQSAMTQVPTVEKLLPIQPDETSDSLENPDFLFEPSAVDILDGLIPKYVASQLFKAILETAASEHGARMTAMDSASNNAKDMIGRLTIQYNRARQAAITTELMDIINGAQSVS